MVRIVNEGPGDADPRPGADVFALQQDFQARLADETLRYLRSLRGLLGPASPGTFLRPQPDQVLRATGRPDQTVEVPFEVENRQETHVIATPMLTALVRGDGTTWFPEAAGVPASLLVAPGAIGQAHLLVRVPAEAGPGRYDGALVLLGVHGGVVPVSLSVEAAPSRRAKRGAGEEAGGPAGAGRPAGAAGPAKGAPRRATGASRAAGPGRAADVTAAAGVTAGTGVAAGTAKKAAGAGKAAGARRTAETAAGVATAAAGRAAAGSAALAGAVGEGAPAKKVPAKKVPAKKVPAEKAPAEKAPVKKAPARRTAGRSNGPDAG